MQANFLPHLQLLLTLSTALSTQRGKDFGWGAGDEDYVVDYKERIEMPFYVRAKATPAEINAKFSDVKFLSRKGQPSDEVAFITDIMTENKLNKSLTALTLSTQSRLQTINLNQYKLIWRITNVWDLLFRSSAVLR